MAMRSFFVEIQKLIIEDLNDDANFENGAYFGVFKKMFKAERLKHRYSDWLEALKADYMTSHENNRFRILKEYYMSYHDWFYCQVLPGYCWKEEKVLFGRRGMAYCLKSKISLSFASEKYEMEFVKTKGAIPVNHYCREHGEKVVCDCMVDFFKRMINDVESIMKQDIAC